MEQEPEPRLRQSQSLVLTPFVSWFHYVEFDYLNLNIASCLFEPVCDGCSGLESPRFVCVNRLLVYNLKTDGKGYNETVVVVWCSNT